MTETAQEGAVLSRAVGGVALTAAIVSLAVFTASVAAPVWLDRIEPNSLVIEILRRFYHEPEMDIV